VAEAGSAKPEASASVAIERRIQRFISRTPFRD
jgi:hypothetical protein